MPTSPIGSPTGTRLGSIPAEARAVVLRVRGVVQGVGFRPFVYRLARRHGLGGWVRNDGEGVLIRAAGTDSELSAFRVALEVEAPAAARVESVEVLEEGAREARQDHGFRIQPSEAGGGLTTLISPDLPVCDDCLRELFDPADRRYRYPFINCTNCGPRYTIVERLPYDRPHTTMSAFPLCDACAAEYHDPADRRFHAQPVACPRCGPQVRFARATGKAADSGGEDADPIEAAAAALRAGEVVAVKGLGGYHLACNALDARAVRTLRERKVRRDKPFALMARDLATAERAVWLDGPARRLLGEPARPIVLAPRRHDALPEALAEALAPGCADLGVMLPYTPVQHLLFAAGAPPLLVMTSANRAGEPIAFHDDEALQRLAGIADAFLIGERPIARRVDDSVATIVDGAPALLRRARGQAPGPVARHEAFTRPVLALGAGLKNAIVLATGGYAFASQHLGDLDDLDAFAAFREAVRDLAAIYRVDLREARVAHDLHPDYPSTRHAATLGGEAFAVQHHHAHVASVLAERGAWASRVLGFAFDGAGLGSDGSVWGGEILHGGLAAGFERVGHLRPVPLPGGDAAARNPRQAAVGFLLACEPSLWRQRFGDRRSRRAEAMVRLGVNAPRTSSVGRLFDTAAALCGFEGTMSFEGQAAMGLEARARRALGLGPEGGFPPRALRSALDDAYPFPFGDGSWDSAPLLEALLRELDRGVDPNLVALRFHAALARGVADAALALASSRRFDAVALSGGVWQNRLLHALARSGLAERGFETWWNRQVPAGDGGVALGQAALAAAGAPAAQLDGTALDPSPPGREV